MEFGGSDLYDFLNLATKSISFTDFFEGWENKKSKAFNGSKYTRLGNDIETFIGSHENLLSLWFPLETKENFTVVHNEKVNHRYRGCIALRDKKDFYLEDEESNINGIIELKTTKTFKNCTNPSKNHITQLMYYISVSLPEYKNHEYIGCLFYICYNKNGLIFLKYSFKNFLKEIQNSSEILDLFIDNLNASKESHERWLVTQSYARSYLNVVSGIKKDLEFNFRNGICAEYESIPFTILKKNFSDEEKSEFENIERSIQVCLGFSPDE